MPFAMIKVNRHNVATYSLCVICGARSKAELDKLIDVPHVLLKVGQSELRS